MPEVRFPQISSGLDRSAVVFVPDENVTIDLRFIKPFKSENMTELTLTPDGDKTNVVWRMTGPNTFMTKVMAFIGRTMDKMVGPDFEKGLSKLKRTTEG